MPQLNRRTFLAASVGAAGVLSGAAAIGWPDLQQAARDRPLADGSGIVVIVTLYGGNDGINTLIPYADNAYHDARPDLAYAASDVLHLDEQLGLNPAMTGMATMWANKSLAIVRGVSYPKPDHSHFRSMDIWQTASPTEPVSTGWIGRWLDASGDDPLRAVNVGPVLPPLAVGAKATAAALSPGGATPKQFDPIMAALGADDPRDTPAMAMVCAAYRATRTADSTFGPLETGDKGQGQQRNSLTEQLDVVARCVKAGVPTRVYMVQLGGFDTHADERGTQQRLLGTLDAALTPFLADMAGDQHGKHVVVMAYSEFGRRVTANASQGTDHGTAGPVFVAGYRSRAGSMATSPVSPTSMTETSRPPPTSATSITDCWPTRSAPTPYPSSEPDATTSDSSRPSLSVAVRSVSKIPISCASATSDCSPMRACHRYHCGGRKVPLWR